MHELGHRLGLQHSDQEASLMDDSLPIGVRRLPIADSAQSKDKALNNAELDTFFASVLEGEDLLLL